MLGSITAIVIPIRALYYMIPITVLYLLLSPVIYLHVGKGFRIFLPFFAMYSLFSTLLGVPFITMIVFMARISVLIMLMVYFSASLRIPRLIEDSRRLSGIPVASDIVFFIIATILFIKSLTNHYRLANISSTRKFMNYSQVIPNLINAIVVNWQNRDEIETEATGILAKPYTQVYFLNKNNVMGCVYITFLVLILSL